MTFIKRFLSSITFRNILIIFTVGLISRVSINYFLEVNVFKEYTSYISLSYFFSMASFTVFINSLPSINHNVFNIGVVSESIRVLLFGHHHHMIVGDDFNHNPTPKNSHEPISEFFTKPGNAADSHKTGKGHSGSASRSKPSVYIPGAGAALYGLYDVDPSKPTEKITRTSNLIYDLYDFDGKQRIRKEKISYPYNPKGTLLSNKGSNNFGYPQMTYSPSTDINVRCDTLMGYLNRNHSGRNTESVCNSVISYLGRGNSIRNEESVRNSIMSYLNHPSSIRNTESVRNSIISCFGPHSTSTKGSILIGLDDTLNTAASTSNATSNGYYLRPEVYVSNSNTKNQTCSSLRHGVCDTSQNTNVRGRINDPTGTSDKNSQSRPAAPNAPKAGYESNIPSYYQYSSLNSRQTRSNLSVKGLGVESTGSNSLFEMELSKRKEKVLEALNNKEVIQGKKSSREDFYFTGDSGSSVKLSLNYTSSSNRKNPLESVFFKFYEKGKRTYHWCMWENRRNNFRDYREFKEFWDIRGSTLMSLDHKAGCSIKDVISELIRIRDPFKRK